MVSMTWRMLGHFWFKLLATLLACAAPFQTIPLTAEQVRVRHMEGLMHGFLALRTLDGRRLADGEMTQIAEGDRVTSRLIFRFKDGSVYDDTTIFSQQGAFRVLSDHLVQRGPSFKQPMCSWIDGTALRETASRHARVGSYWRCPGFRQIGRSALRRWPPLAD